MPNPHFRRIFTALRRAPRWLPLALLLALRPAAAQAPAPQGGILGPGDVLRIMVYQHAELSGDIEVGDDGRLVHPLYRGVEVTGVPRAELDARLASFLRRYQETPTFVAEPLVRVTIAGDARQPGVITTRPSTTLFQAMAQAGGASDRGRLSRVVLMRGGETLRYDLSSPHAPGARETVRSGDVLVVGRRPAQAREYVAPVASVMTVLVTVVNLLRSR